MGKASIATITKIPRENPNERSFVVTDQYGHPLLFEPTTLDIFDAEHTTSPFIYDSGSYTVFTDWESLRETLEVWSDLMGTWDWGVFPVERLDIGGIV